MRPGVPEASAPEEGRGRGGVPVDEDMRTKSIRSRWQNYGYHVRSHTGHSTLYWQPRVLYCPEYNLTLYTLQRPYEPREYP